MKHSGGADLIGLWPERKPWIADPWYIAIFALVPMVTTTPLCVFSTFGAAFPSMTCFTFAFT
jgi:hypothetical protein